MPIIKIWGSLSPKIPAALLLIFQIFVFFFILSKGTCGPDGSGAPFTGFSCALYAYALMIPLIIYGIFLIIWAIIYALTKIIFKKHPSRGLAVRNILVSLAALYLGFVQFVIIRS